jgi:hypothetical protein
MWFWHTVAIAGLTLMVLIAASVSRIGTELSSLRTILEIVYHEELYGPEHAEQMRKQREQQVQELVN